jgi:hypothetical protein
MQAAHSWRQPKPALHMLDPSLHDLFDKCVDPQLFVSKELFVNAQAAGLLLFPLMKK